LRLPDSDAELVLHTDERPIVTDLLVASVPAAIGRFVEAGGKVIAGPFEIRIGLCAMIEDPWQNRLVILDSSKGLSEPMQKGMSLRVVRPHTCVLTTLRVPFLMTLNLSR
jgi:hypothetical protein